MVSISQILKDEANKYRRVLKGKGEDRAAAGGGGEGREPREGEGCICPKGCAMMKNTADKKQTDPKVRLYKGFAWNYSETGEPLVKEIE